MRWSEGRRSGNVIDARGGGGMMVRAGGGLGMVVLALLAYFVGIDPRAVMDSVPAAQAPQQQPGAQPKDPMADFVSVVLADTEDTWEAIFKQKYGQDYRDPQLVLFSDAVQSECGVAQSAMGPFYCPLDQRVYIDLAFYRDLKERFAAPGDFAQAYVVAHEVGHHVQTLLGISEKVTAAQQRSSKVGANQLSVRQELQADCFAGIWAHHAQRARNVVEPGDIDEALNAASAIGDDRIQQQARGRVAPESFTHGSSRQRMTWFRRGYDTGEVDACNTFSDANGGRLNVD